MSIDNLINEDPVDGYDSVKIFDATELSEDDRCFYGLLKVKGADKNYVTHKNDSLIREVLNYYSSHNDDPYYAEAMYYGGRVYSDLGDYPTSIKYFQKTIDYLSPDNNNLRKRAYSQMGRLLETLHLYEQASYYLREAIKSDTKDNDTVNMSFDHSLLGKILMNIEKYDSARYHLEKSLWFADKLSTEHKSMVKMYLATLYYKLGKIDSSLLYIRNTPEDIWEDTRDQALANAAVIYKKAGILDTAYAYAKELITMKGEPNRRFGYVVLSEPPLNALIPEDSLYQFYSDFREEMLSAYDGSVESAARYQNTAYNYELHERARLEAEKGQERMKIIALILTACILAALCVIIWLRMKSKIRRMVYSKMMYNLLLLNQQLAAASILSMETGRKLLSSPGNPDNADSREEIHLLPMSSKMSVEQMREHHRLALLALCESGNIRPLVADDPITGTPSYKTLQDMVQLDKMIPENDPFWLRLRDDILSVSPMFFDRLQALAAERMKSKDLHTAMLIRCGISPSKMCIIFSRGKGSISQRRETLNRKLFDRKIDYKTMDMIIQSL